MNQNATLRAPRPRRLPRVVPLLVGLLFVAVPVYGVEIQHRPATPAVAAPAAPVAESGVYWILFTDKGHPDWPAALAAAERETASLDAHRARRLSVRGGVVSLEYVDLPVYPSYAAAMAAAGAKLRAESRWLNGVSAWLSAEALAAIRALPFVREIAPVPPTTRRPVPEPETTVPEIHAPAGTTAIDYGPSFTQLDQMQVVAMHDLGFTGSGVRIGVLDSGFNWQDHPATASRTVAGEWDFVEGDSDPSGAVSFSFHGTQVLSVIAGYAPGQLIGPAFGAEFLLARTESVAQEEPYEEDWFVAGLEWCEALGADIVTSSLGYSDWYGPGDYDGRTTVTAQACNQAADRGVLVLTAAGNQGPSRRSLVTPSDAFGVLGIGAVDGTGQVASFSSRGPTADDRYKPDLMARGSGTWMVNADNPGQVRTGNGTSYATPLVAGAAALLLQARPTLSATDVRVLLRVTGGRADQVDTEYGWGIVRVLEAYATEVPDDFVLPDADWDDDGIVNDFEVFPGDGLRSNRFLPDSDGDGLSDSAEDLNRDGRHDPLETRPTAPDTDGDGVEDGIEVRYLETDPRIVDAPAADADGDALPDTLDPDPGRRDTDGDRYDDGYEAAQLDLAAVSAVTVFPSLGDVSGDSFVSNLDALIVQALFLGLQHPAQFHAARADADRNASVTNLDGLLVQTFFIGSLAALPLRP